MQHNLTICVGSPPPVEGIVRCRTVSLRERLLRALLGERRRVVVIVPGGSVRALDIREVPGTGGDSCA